MQNITQADYYFLPFYLILIYLVAFIYRNKRYPRGNPFRPYFIPGLTAKILGSIAIGMIYEYYYGGGDTFNFFYHTQLINNSFNISAGTWFRLITHSANDQNINDLYAMSDMYWYNDLPSYTVASIGAFLGIFCFTKYLPINVLLATISFTGLWALFVTFGKQYKHLVKPIAIATLFMPSVIIWGSGLFKDTVCMAAIGWLTYSFYILFEDKRFKGRLLLLIVLSSWLLFFIKAYILVSFLPLLIFKTVLTFKQRLLAFRKTRWIAYLIFPLMVITGLYSYDRISDKLVNFSIENIIKTVIQQKDYLLRISLDQEGSAYDLGPIDPSIKGVLKKAIPAINVTLFRPYVWEAKSILTLFTSLEAFAILLFTLVVVFKRKPFQCIKQIYRDPNLILCLMFTLIFALFAGLSSFNFGTLSRYKIPCIPFYMLFLVILLYDKEINGKREAKSPEL